MVAAMALLAVAAAASAAPAWASTRQTCCPKNSGPACTLPDCPPGQFCAWAGEEEGPPTCQAVALPRCGPALSVAMVQDKLRLAGLEVGEALEDPYACSPQPCGDLPQLGRLTALPAPAWTAAGALEQSFEFSDFGGDPAGDELPGGRPWRRAESSLLTVVERALGRYTARIVVSRAPLAAGVKLVAALRPPTEDACQAA